MFFLKKNYMHNTQLTTLVHHILFIILLFYYLSNNNIQTWCTDETSFTSSVCKQDIYIYIHTHAGERFSCFLALDRAADSLFLIMRLCLRLPEFPSDSGNLFFPNSGKLAAEAKASNDTFIEEMFETGGVCKIMSVPVGSELAIGQNRSGPEFRLSATAGGDAGGP